MPVVEEIVAIQGTSLKDWKKIYNARIEEILSIITFLSRPEGFTDADIPTVVNKVDALIKRGIVDRDIGPKVENYLNRVRAGQIIFIKNITNLLEQELKRLQEKRLKVILEIEAVAAKLFE